MAHAPSSGPTAHMQCCGTDGRYPPPPHTSRPSGTTAPGACLGLLVEGFGISCVEASACGLPVIGSRSGGIPEAIREGETGLLVEPEDPAAVTAATVRVLADDALRRRLGAAGRAAVEGYYNWDRVTADLVRIDREFNRP